MSTVYPHTDFLENEEAYLAAQQVWRDLIGRIATVHGHEPTGYMDLEQNGKPVRDGNPLVAVKVSEKAIRIIQLSQSEEGNDFSAWFNTFGKGDPERETEELVLDLKLTHATLSIAAILIELWVSDRLNEQILGEWLLPWAFEEE
jgi:hypothetical protein